MLDRKIESKKALLVHGKIQSNGKRVDDGYSFMGLKATSSYDGYTCMIADDHVCLYLYFHNKYKIEFDNQLHLSAFEEKLRRVELS